jgi:hypothetical protein
MRKGKVALAAVGCFAVAGLAVAHADLTDWGGDDSRGVASGEASYCKTDDCKAIARHDKSYGR